MVELINLSIKSVVTMASLILVTVIALMMNSFLQETEVEEIAYMGVCGIGGSGYYSITDTTDYGRGKALFKNNCASCHNKDMKSKMTGPALGGVSERWAAYPKEDLYNWIRSSQQMIAEGHPRALEMWDEWKPTVMNNFPALTDEDIENILAYIEMGNYRY